MIIKKTKEVKAFKAGDDTLIREVLHPQNDSLALPYSIAHARLGPGESSLPHSLKKSSEVYYILEGHGHVVIDGKEALIEAGDLVYIPAGLEQYVINGVEEELLFLCIVSPAWQKNDEEISTGT